jgi:hypothetical protein
MRLLRALAVSILLLAGQSVLAAQGSAVNVTIKRLQINKNLGNMVFVELATAPAVQAGCAAGAWHFLLSLDDAAGKNMYAQLLVAYSSGQAVDIGGSGLCGWGTVEDLATVALRTN